MFTVILSQARRVFILFLALLICLPMFPAGDVHAQTVTPIVRAGEEYNAVVGTYVDVSIFVANAPSMAGFQFDLRYDQEIAVVKARPGDNYAVKLGSFFTGAHPIVNLNDAENGLIRVVWTQLHEDMGSGEMCRITFEIRSTGTTPLRLSNVELVDFQGVIGAGGHIFQIELIDGLITSEAQIDVDVSGVSIAGGNQDIVQGETLQLSVDIEPPNATNRTLTWSSSNTAVATVDSNGLITAVGEGTAQITVTAADGGFKDTITVTVRPSGIVVETPRELPNAYTGRHYDHTLAARGENDSFSWSRISGSLPPGLYMTSAGRIYGTPTGSGRYDFTIRVTDNDGNRTDRNFVLWVAESASTGYHSGMLYNADWGAFKNLNINHGSLEVDLQPHELPYTMVVDRNTSNVKLQVSLLRSSDRLRINGNLQSPTIARTITLRPRNNVITVSIHPSSGDPKHHNITIFKIP